MIEIIEKHNPTVIKEVTDYLAAALLESGVCGEHNPSWLEVLRAALGHRTFMLIARGQESQLSSNSSAIRGYLPLALVSSGLFGRFLVSLPYLNRAGVVTTDPQVRVQLIDRAVELANEHNVRYLELRHHGQVADHPILGAKRDDKVLMVLDLPDSSDALWKAIHSKVRNQIRKGDKENLTLRWGGVDVLDDFYDVFAVNMRDLGTPVFSKRLFSSILKYLKDRAELAVVHYQRQPVAGALLIHDRHSTQVPSASALRQFNHTNANMWMYHQLLLRAIERGSRQFDFGRSSVDSGTYKFKKQWGAQPQPTIWQYHVRHGDFNSMRPDNPKNQRRVAMWQKLPVWLTRLIGPPIVRGIP